MDQVNTPVLRSAATYQAKGRGTVKICRTDKIPQPLLGQDIQSGECEFVDIDGEGVDAELIAAKRALLKLRERLGMPDAPFYFGNSHPYGNG